LSQPRNCLLSRYTKSSPVNPMLVYVRPGSTLVLPSPTSVFLHYLTSGRAAHSYSLLLHPCSYITYHLHTARLLHGHRAKNIRIFSFKSNVWTTHKKIWTLEWWLRRLRKFYTLFWFTN
jgi:hypothetical protein